MYEYSNFSKLVSSMQQLESTIITLLLLNFMGSISSDTFSNISYSYSIALGTLLQLAEGEHDRDSESGRVEKREREKRQHFIKYGPTTFTFSFQSLWQLPIRMRNRTKAIKINWNLAQFVAF